MPGKYYKSMPGPYWAVLIISAVGWAGRFVFPFLTLYMSNQVGFDVSLTGLIMSLYGFGGLTSVLISGVLIDKLGAKSLLLTSIIGTGVSACGLVFATDKVIISALILLVGLFSTIMAPSINTIITFHVDAAVIREAFSLQYVAINLGFAAAPLLSGFLVQVSYSLLFVAEAIVMGISFVIGLIFIPNNNQVAKNYSVLDTASIPVLQAEGILKDRTFIFFIALNILFMVMYMQTQILLPLVLAEQGFNPVEYGFILTLNGLLVTTLQIPIDSITRRIRLSRLMIIGMIFLPLGFSFHALGGGVYGMHIAAMVIWSVAEIFNTPVASAVTSKLAPPGKLGAYQGTLNTTNPLASLLGPILGGFLLQNYGSTILWTVCIAALLVGAALRGLSAPSIDRRIINSKSL